MELKLAVVGALVAVVAQVFAETQPARLETFDAPTGKSVTWRRLNELDTGLRQIGRLATCGAKDIKANSWSIGCETLDRDYAK